uniref:Uncharacterized protein n=1 Tax=Timema tahoe TaxID=61484 RepID=A0A7R9IIC8_9NEOP|nr:unnamed protein product [Timema tahoe]
MQPPKWATRIVPLSQPSPQSDWKPLKKVRKKKTVRFDTRIEQIPVRSRQTMTRSTGWLQEQRGHVTSPGRQVWVRDYMNRRSYRNKAWYDKEGLAGSTASCSNSSTSLIQLYKPELRLKKLSLSSARKDLPVVFKTHPRPGGLIRTLVPPNDVPMRLSEDLDYRSASLVRMLRAAGSGINQKSRKKYSRSSIASSYELEKRNDNLKGEQLSIVVSTVMLLARGRHGDVNDRLGWTRNFLEAVKDDRGKLPPNVTAIVDIIEKTHRDNDLAKKAFARI